MNYKLRFTSSGGKAGKGYNKTASVQVIDGNGMLVKNIPYLVGSDESFKRAKAKAEEFIKLAERQ